MLKVIDEQAFTMQFESAATSCGHDKIDKLLARSAIVQVCTEKFITQARGVSKFTICYYQHGHKKAQKIGMIYQFKALCRGGISVHVVGENTRPT